MSPQMIGSSLLAALVVIAPLDARQVVPSASQLESRVFGIVLDENEKVVPGALVMLGDGRSTETDGEGRFSFYRVSPGQHEIAAVAPTCETAAGGFQVQSGSDKQLQLIVARAAREENRSRRSRGTATRTMDDQRLMELGSRTALDALLELAPNDFVVQGSRLALLSRRGSSTDEIIEPLLVMDGVRMPGMVAESLLSLKARDLASLEVHMGSAAGWEFQNGGAQAVVEVTMRMTPAVEGASGAEICRNR